MLSFHETHCSRHTRPQSHGGGEAPRPPIVPDAGGSCPDGTLAPVAQDLERLRIAVVCLVNRERLRHGERPLRWNEHLTAAAQAHSESMVAGDYFSHDGPAGETPAERMRRFGYIYDEQVGYEVGENIGWGTLSLGTPAAMVSSWMASAGHRANILDPNFRDTGVGAAAQVPTVLPAAEPGGTYTEDFGVITG